MASAPANPVPGLQRAAAAALPLVLALAPFEPRAPLLRAWGTELTLLELAAAAAALLMLAAGRERLAELLRQAPLPLLALGAYAAVHALSALAAPEHRGQAARFALRMAAAALFALAVAVAPPQALRRAPWALAAAGVVVAALAVAEVAGAQALDPWLDRFRDSRVVVGAVRRATAGSAHPNLAGAFLACALVAGTAVLSRRARPWPPLLPFAALLAAGLLATYSRGALLAAALGLAAVALALPRGGRRPAGAALLVLAVAAGAGLGAPAFRLRAGGGGDTAAWFAVRTTPEDARLALRPGESRTVGVVVENTGRIPWEAGHGYMAAYRLRERETGARVGEGFGPPLEQDLAPGARRRLALVVHAPRRPGRYLVGWDMVHPHAGWFSEHGSRPAWVPLDVTPGGVALPDAGEPPPRLPALEVPPSRGELWAAALALWRERPLLGVGPDNFRRLQARALGRPSDERTYANNALLEALANTGLLGAAALLATLGAMLLRGARHEPALCGLAVVIAAHGLVDYVLAFNGHALVLAFVAGALSRPHLPTRASS